MHLPDEKAKLLQEPPKRLPVMSQALQQQKPKVLKLGRERGAREGIGKREEKGRK